MTCPKCHTEFRKRSLTIDGGKTQVSVERCDCGWAKFVEEYTAAYEAEPGQKEKRDE